MHYVIPQHLSKYAITVNMQYETESVMKGGLIQSHNERCCYLPITLNSKWSLLKYQPRRRYISTLSNRIVSGNWRYCPCLCGLFIHRERERESDYRIPNYKRSSTRCLRGSTHQHGRRRKNCTKYNYSYALFNDGDTF